MNVPLLLILAAGGAAQPASPIIQLEPDGSFVVQAIEAKPVPLAQATAGLVADVETPPRAGERRKRRRSTGMRDRDVERAYEDAVDMARVTAADARP